MRVSRRTKAVLTMLGVLLLLLIFARQWSSIDILAIAFQVLVFSAFALLVIVIVRIYLNTQKTERSLATLEERLKKENEEKEEEKQASP